jgi:hypothetical protein
MLKTVAPADHWHSHCCSRRSPLLAVGAAILLLLHLDGGVSHAAGYTWKPLRIGAGGWLTGMDIAPDGTKVVRADTYGAYVWSVSEWRQVVTSTSMPAADVRVDNSYGVYEIRIAPSDSSRLYMMYGGAIYRSNNRGGAWTKTSFTPVAGCDANDEFRFHGQKMAIDPGNPDVVYVGTTDSGLWVTADGGSSWSRVAAIPNGVSGEGGITGIALDTSSGTSAGRTQVIYACSWGNGVYRSANAGASWTRTTGGPTTVHHAVVSSDGTYYATDGAAAWKFVGSTWTSMSSEQDWRTVAVDPANPARIVLGNGGGYLSQSLDRGATWGDVIWGTSAHPTTRVASDIPWLAWTQEEFMSSGDMIFDPTASNKLYFSEGIGVWSTTDLTPTQTWDVGVTWSSQSRGIEQLVAYQVVVPPTGKPLVVSGDRPVFRVDDPDSFPSRHGPDNEHAIVAGWDADYALDDPLYVAAVMNWAGIEKSGHSSDGGRTWALFATHPPFAEGFKIGGGMAVSTAGNLVWAPENNGVPYFTKNGGATWVQASFPGAPTSGETGWGFFYLLDRNIVAADRVRPGRFYAYNYIAGLYASDDGGEHWTLRRAGELQLGSGWNAKLRAVPGFEGHLFFTVGQQGNAGDQNPADYAALLRSTDGGITWTSLPRVKEVYDVGFGRPATQGGYPAVFIAGWFDDVWGVWVSTDNCATWAQAGDFPLRSLDMIRTVAGDPNIFGRVYVGFAGSGYAYGDIGTAPSMPRKVRLRP